MSISLIDDGSPAGWHQSVNSLISYWQGGTAPSSFGSARATLNAIASDMGMDLVLPDDTTRAKRRKINAMIAAANATIPDDASLYLDFLSGRYFGAPMSFTRPSQAIYFDASNVMQIAGNNVMRLDHDPLTGAPRGILIEEQRTNLAWPSADYANARWTKGNLTVSASPNAAPDGNLAAFKAIPSATSTTHVLGHPSFVSTPETATLSIFAKSQEIGVFGFRIATPAYVGRVRFDVSSGSILSIDSPLSSASIAPVGDGWFRCSVTYTAPVGSTAAVYQVEVHGLDGSLTSPGDGTSGLLLWGAQAELGAFPTSYIPTVGAAATRAADVSRVDNLGWIGPSENSFVFDFTCPNLDNLSSGGGANSRRHLISMQTVGENNGLYIYLQPGVGRTATLQAVVTNAGNVTTHSIGPSDIAEGRHRIALALFGTNARASVDGGAIRSSTTVQAIPWAAFNRAYFWAQLGGSRLLNGHGRSVASYPRSLSDLELRAMAVLS